MLFFIIFSFLLTVDFGLSISQGYVATDETHFPYIASLQYKNRRSSEHFCGAVIISSRILLSSAQCNVYPPRHVIAKVGTIAVDDPNAATYPLRKWFNHNESAYGHYLNDISVIILDKEIKFNKAVQPIPLASDPIETLVFKDVTMAGWGLTQARPNVQPRLLQFLETVVLSQEKCNNIFNNEQLGTFCTFESKLQSACSGDIGGPVVNEVGKLVGIITKSWDCPNRNPDLITDVYYFKEWILKNTKGYI